MHKCNQLNINLTSKKFTHKNFWNKKKNRLIAYITAALALSIVIAIIVSGIAVSMPNWIRVCSISYGGSYHHYTIGDRMYTYFDVASDTNSIEVDGILYDLGACHVNDDYGYEATGHSRDGICAIHCLDDGKPIMKEAFNNFDAIINNPWIDGNGNLHCTFVIPLRDGHGLDVQDMGAEEMVIPPINGGISVQKDTSLSWSKNIANYSLEGATYDIYSNLSDAQNYTNSIQQITLDDQGYGQTGQYDRKVGTYYVRENKNSHGKNYLINPDIGVVNVKSGQIYPTSFNGSTTTYDTPANEPNPPIIQKSNLETNNPGVTAGDASDFSEAKYKFSYFSEYFTSISQAPDVPLKYWTGKTNSLGKIGLSEKYKGNFVSEESSKDKDGNIDFYKNSNGEITNPLGTYVIKETQAPYAYLLSEKTYIIQIIPDDNSQTGTKAACYDGDTGELISTFIDPNTNETILAAPEQIIRGDFSFNKVNEEHKPMSNIPFLIKSLSTGEAHVMVSDVNGCIDTDSKHVLHSINTNANDKYVDLDKAVVLDASSLSPNCGVWFSQDKSGRRCAADNEKCALPHDTYSITELVVDKNKQYQPFENRTATITTQGYKLSLPDWVNSKAQIITNANCLTTNDKWTYASSNETIEDTIKYVNFVPGNEYVIKSWLVDTKDASIVPIKSGSSHDNYIITNYSCKTTSGEIKVNADYDTSKYVGHNLVWFTEIKLSNNTIVCTRQDLTDALETVSIKKPSIETNLHIKGETRQELSRYSDLALCDEISFSGLKPHEHYSINGVLYNKKTGQPYINELTKTQVSTSLNFCAPSENGTTAIEYNFDGSLIPNEETLVSFVDININDTNICSLKDINNVKESVHMPTTLMTTNLTCGENSEKTFIAQNQEILNDSINYENLPLNRTCNIFTWLVNSKTGLPIHNNNTDTDTAKSTMDSFVNYLGGHVIERTIDDDLVTNEKQNNDSNNKQWLVEFDEPANKIKDASDISFAASDFSNIAFNQNDVIVHNSQDITIAPLQFDFANCEKQDVVALTVVVCGDTVVSNSTDINNKAETVSITRSNIATCLTDIDGNKETLASPQIMLKDVVNYSNCITDKKYTLKGQIIRKSDCSIVTENSKEISFDASSGTTENDFQVASADLVSEDLVCYETLYLGNDIAAEDCNIDNQEQTVHVKSQIENIVNPDGTTNGTKTGDKVLALIAAIIIIIISSSFVSYRIYKRRH